MKFVQLVIALNSLQCWRAQQVRGLHNEVWDLTLRENLLTIFLVSSSNISMKFVKLVIALYSVNAQEPNKVEDYRMSYGIWHWEEILLHYLNIIFTSSNKIC